ncbi:hypothetical protein LguiA_025804 [Lonicera macranthoides]
MIKYRVNYKGSEPNARSLTEIKLHPGVREAQHGKQNMGYYKIVAESGFGWPNLGSGKRLGGPGRWSLPWAKETELPAISVHSRFMKIIDVSMISVIDLVAELWHILYDEKTRTERKKHEGIQSRFGVNVVRSVSYEREGDRAQEEEEIQKLMMSIYLSRAFPRSNSRFFLCSGNTLKSEVLRLREEMFLVDVGLGTPRICMQDEPIGLPINRATRFENKVGSLDLVAGESLIKDQILERFFTV